MLFIDKLFTPGQFCGIIDAIGNLTIFECSRRAYEDPENLIIDIIVSVLYRYAGMCPDT